MEDIRTIEKAALAKLLGCGICSGIIVEAVSLPECSHVFCKSCIVMHCNTLPVVCPQIGCRSNIHASRPLNYLKNDTNLQTLINKLFPEVYLDEMDRRRRFFENYISQRDATIYHLTGEQIGIPQNRDWFLPIPTLVQLTLQYDADLEQNEMCIRPARLCKKIHAVAMASSATIKNVRKFLCSKHGVDRLDQVVLLHSNSPVKEDYELGYFLRFGMVEGDNILHLKYCFINFPSHFDALNREASIRQMIHRKPLNTISIKIEDPHSIEFTQSIPEPKSLREAAFLPIRANTPQKVPETASPPTSEATEDAPPKGPNVIISRLSKPVKKRRHVPDIVTNRLSVQEKEQVEKDKNASRILNALFLTEHTSVEPESEPYFQTCVISVATPPKRPKFADTFPRLRTFVEEVYGNPIIDDQALSLVSSKSEESADEAYVVSILEEHNYSKSVRPELQELSQERSSS